MSSWISGIPAWNDDSPYTFSGYVRKIRDPSHVRGWLVFPHTRPFVGAHPPPGLKHYALPTPRDGFPSLAAGLPIPYHISHIPYHISHITYGIS